jgi:hypothetical protein
MSDVPPTSVGRNPAPIRLPRPIRALTWQTQAGAHAPRWLLPAAAVLEVVRCAAPRPVPLPLDTDPALVCLLLGTVPWRDRHLPLLWLTAEAYDPAPSGADAAQSPPLRAVVCPSLHDAHGAPVFGLAAFGMPRLVTLRDGDLAPDADDAPPIPYSVAGLWLQGARCAVPDLEALGAALAPLAALLE